MAKDFNAILKERRTAYVLSKESPVSDTRIEEVIKDAVKYTPSAFNSQSARVVVLFGKQHNKVWDISMETLRKIVPENSFASTEEKINSFRNGYGTVLYFEDVTVTEELQEKFPLYKDNFPVWAQQSNGMLQYVVWDLLQIEGLGASLQHYNPLIDDGVRKQWSLPETWKLIAQMPFGKPNGTPDVKQFQPIEERLKIFK